MFNQFLMHLQLKSWYDWHPNPGIPFLSSGTSLRTFQGRGMRMTNHPNSFQTSDILIGRNFLKSMLKSCLKFHEQWLNQLKALTCGISRITLFRRLPPLWIPSSEKRMWMGFYWEMRIDQNKTGQLRNETCFSWKPNSVRSENLTDSLDMLKIGWSYKWSYS